jgi:hypothetical protein
MAADAYQQQQALAANLFNQDQQRQAYAYGQELDFTNAQMQRDFVQGQSETESLEQTAREIMTGLDKLNLDENGKRERAQYTNALRATLTDQLRPEARAEVLRNILGEIDKSGLEEREIKEPTPDELWTKGTRTEDDGTVYGLDRNGTWRKLKDPPPRQLTPEEVQQHTYQMPDGSTMFINPADGKPYFNKPEATKAEKPVDPVQQRADAMALVAKATAAAKSAQAKDNMAAIDEPAIRSQLKLAETFEAEIRGGGAQASAPADAAPQEPQLGPGDQLYVAPDGARAILHTDGTVTPYP